MGGRFVGSGHKIVQCGNFVVRINRKVESNGSDISAMQFGMFGKGFFVCRLQPLATDQVFHFDEVDFMVTANQSCYQSILIFKKNGFDDLLGRKVQELRYLLHRFFPGCLHFF